VDEGLEEHGSGLMLLGDRAGGQTPLWSETRDLVLDLRSIKIALGMNLVPRKTPAMVCKQVRMTLLFRPSSSDSELPHDVHQWD
jgi:hypothetical protein